jgi:hypothetical protein
MPSQAILNIHKNSEDKPKNAFWLSSEEPLSIEELYREVHAASAVTEDLFYKQHQIEASVDHIKHVGYMVSSVIDSQVENLNERMVRISELHHTYIETNDASAADMLADESLHLGYDFQYHTQNLMRELGVSGEPLESRLLKGNSELKGLFVDSSLLFPSNWNEAMTRGKLKTIKLLKNESVIFDRHKKFFLGKKKNTSSFTSSPSKKVKKDEFEIIYGSDGRYAYPDWVTAQEASQNTPLIFHTRHEIIHEMTHMYEKKDFLLGHLTESFLKSRLNKSSTGDYYYYPQYDKEDRRVYSDHFPNLLSGTVYDKKYQRNEILPRGTESVLGGANGSFLGLPQYFGDSKEPVKVNPDIDYRNFMLGILFGHRK